jgi:DNA-binding winged helix-turn-helix (wHTH) protein/tetratricopeptide (TPR) repeat protein
VILAFADVELDIERYELRRAGERVQVEPQVFDVLVHLARHAGRLITKEELLDAVWGDRFVSESALTSRIKTARRCVGDDGQNQRVIATVHGRGYRFVPAVHERSVSAAGRPEPPSTTRRLEALLERDELLAHLAAALDAASAGAGRVVLVAGDAGLGKTSLVQQFAKDAANRAIVLTGAADDLTTSRPLGPVRDVLDQLPLDLRRPGRDELAPEHVRAALEQLAAASGQPVLVVLEDLHWADDATLDVVRYLARRIRTLPVVVVLTHRVQTLDVGTPLRRLLGSLRGPEVVRLVLEPLTVDAVTSLAAGSVHDAAAVHRVTSGNPLFVSELLAAPPGTVPQTVRDAVLARGALLPPETVEALGRLAVVPARVERWLARELVDGDEPTWSPAERAGLLDGDATCIWFRHELVRRALEETMTASERVQAHQAVARLLWARRGEPSRVIHHASAADDAELVVTVGPVAAAEAQRAGAHRQTVQHAQTVLLHAEQLPPAVHAELLTRLAHSLYLLNRFEESLMTARRGVALARSHGDTDLLARALLTLGRTALWAEGPDAAIAIEGEALEVLGDDGALDLRAIAHADLARASGELVTIGSVAQGSPAALEHATQALVLADHIGRPDLRGYALMYQGCERLALGDEEGARDIDDAIAVLDKLPRVDLAVRACVNASGAAFRAGRSADAERYVALGLELGRDSEFVSGEYRLALTRASVRAARGRWGEAVAELESLLASTGEPGIMAPLAGSLLARLLARQSRWAEAEAVLRDAEAEAPETEVRVVGPITIARVEVSWLSGTDAGAGLAELARPVLEQAEATANTAIQAELARYLQRGGAQPGPVRGAPEPWASGLRGDWRESARRWAARGETYEQAIELLAGEDPASAATAHDLLRSLGATGTLTALDRT